jgi:arylsulfatase
MVGKWHLAKDSDISDAGPRHSWPCQRGFDRFYGFLDGFTNLHHPHRLVEDNHAVPVDRYPDGYYLTDDLTDRAISMVQAVKASDPTKPFFLYFAHGAVHAPLHAPAEAIERQKGRYRDGWDRLREERFRRQLTLGVVAEGTQLPPRNGEPDHDVPPWDDLSPAEHELFARHMEVYAAMVECVDTSFGRLRATLEELGEWDNTVVLFTSDNGASREGEATGTTAYYVHLTTHSDVDADHARLVDIGGPRTTPHYPRGWAMASNTPFRLYKINTHAGGHQVATIVRAPSSLEGGAGAAGSVRHQYVHVTDVLPTVLELIGIEAPAERAGSALLPLAGCSFAATLTDAGAPSTHVEQHYEMQGHRGYYRDGWEVVTLHRPMTSFTADHWELYDLRADPTELADRSGEHPELVAELAAAWERAAWANQVFPLDEGTYIKHLVRPPGTERFARPVTLRPGTPTLERWRSQQLVAVRSFRVVVHTDHGADDAGVLVAHGDQGGGYALYVEDGSLRWVLNDGRGSTRVLDAGAMPEGPSTVVADVRAPGGGRWDVTVTIGDEERARGEAFALLFPMAPFEGIDVGVDRRSPVSWDLYERHGPFPYTGGLESVTYEPGDPAPDSPYVLIDTLREMGARFE